LVGTSWRVGRIAGIEVRVDSSWVVIALLITYSMYLRFSVLYKDLSTGTAAGIAILAAVTMSRIKAAASSVPAVYVLRDLRLRSMEFAAVLRSPGWPGRRGAGCGR
jgi:hypothetical protein